MEELSFFRVFLAGQRAAPCSARKGATGCDKHKLAELFEEEAFQNITTETQKIIAVHLDVKELKKKVIEEDEDMCKAYRELVKDWKQEGRLEGKREGRQEGRQEGILEGQKNRLIQDIQNLMDSLRLTAEQAMDALKIEGEERANCYKLLGKNITHAHGRTS